MMNLYPEVCSVLDKNRMLFLQLESRPNSSFHRLGISLWIFTYFFLPLRFLSGRRPAIHGHENYVAGETVSAIIACTHRGANNLNPGLKTGGSWVLTVQHTEVRSTGLWVSST